MSKLKVGFGRSNINPPMGIDVSGYYKVRFAEGILDDLEANVLALEFGSEKALLINFDGVGMRKELSADFRAAIGKATGICADKIFISQTHTHTGPSLGAASQDDAAETVELINEYIAFLRRRLVDTSVAALADLKEAKMGYGKGTAPGVAFVRRFIMKDGSVQTNPGVNNPNIDRPIGDVDESVNVLRFDREGGDTVVLVNFGNHPDVVGGNLISGDWPGLLRRDVEKILDNTKCIFFNGAQGDVNHVNVHPTGGFLNGTFNDFDDVSRGYDHAKYISRVVTGGVLQAFDKVQYTDVDKVVAGIKTISVASNKADPSELPEAHRINDLHNAGKDSELPYEGMMLTTVVAKAARMVALENGPDAFDMPLSAVVIGPVALIGLPGEAFTGIGVGLKATEGYEMVLPCVITNGYEGYFPMQDAYDEGGYEAGSSKFKAGVAEYMIEQGKAFLEVMNK